jgi:hypothetical protein
MHISLYVHAKFTKHGMQAIHVIPDELIIFKFFSAILKF